jgi:hypothetical protein
MYQRVFLGAIHNVPDRPTRVHHAPHFDPGDMHDLRRREWAAVLPLAAAILILGVGSKSMLPPVTAANVSILAGPSRLDPRLALDLPRLPAAPGLPPNSIGGAVPELLAKSESYAPAD